MQIPQEAFRPFGEGDCESEHSDVYVPDSPFAKAALNPELYLIVGRRGTGKTALARYFSLQRILPNCVHIPIGEGEGYPRLMSLLTSAAALIGNQSATTANFHFVRIWKFAIWSAICGIVLGNRPPPPQHSVSCLFHDSSRTSASCDSARRGCSTTSL